MTTYVMSTMQLPWSFANDDARFKKILSVSMAIFLAIAIPITLTKLPELTRKEKADLPPQLARVMLEKQELPPPKPIEPPKEEKKPEEKKPVEKLPEKKPVTNNTSKPVENAKNVDSKSDAVANAKAQAQAECALVRLHVILAPIERHCACDCIVFEQSQVRSPRRVHFALLVLAYRLARTFKN